MCIRKKTYQVLTFDNKQLANVWHCSIFRSIFCHQVINWLNNYLISYFEDRINCSRAVNTNISNIATTWVNSSLFSRSFSPLSKHRGNFSSEFNKIRLYSGIHTSSLHLVSWITYSLFLFTPHPLTLSPSPLPSAYVSPTDGGCCVPSYWDNVSHRGLIWLPVSCPLLPLSNISTESLNYLTGAG